MILFDILFDSFSSQTIEDRQIDRVCRVLLLSTSKCSAMVFTSVNWHRTEAE